MESAMKQIPERAHMALQRIVKEIEYHKKLVVLHRKQVILYEKIIWENLLALNPDITNTEIVWKGITIRRPTWR